MKKLLLNLAGTMLLTFAVSNVAHATPINGSIGFAGVFTTNDNADFTGATSIAFPGSITLGATSGDYALVPSFYPVTFSSFSFSTLPPTLWNFSFALKTYAFQATSISVSATTNSLILAGNGVASITGLDDTAGTWIITANSAGANFTFSSSAAVAAVPDGGTTALLLGFGLVLLSLAAFRGKTA